MSPRMSRETCSILAFVVIGRAGGNGREILSRSLGAIPRPRKLNPAAAGLQSFHLRNAPG
jgi:hypothetical protein